jgi:hypothetical protein
MGFEVDVLGLRAARDTAAARDDEDFDWLENQIEDFNALVLQSARILKSGGAPGVPVAEEQRGLFGGPKYVLTGETSWRAGQYAITDAGLYVCKWHRTGAGPFKGRLSGHPSADGYVILGDRAEEHRGLVLAKNLGAYSIGVDYLSSPPSRVLELDYIGFEAGSGDAKKWLTGAVARLLP